MTRILITGDAGFLGRALTDEMLCHGDYSVMGYDIARSPQQDVLSSKGLAEVMTSYRPDVVVHLAAEVGKLNCEQNPAVAALTNVVGTMNVAWVCDSFGADLVYCSTSEVYGDHGSSPIHEGTPFADKTSGMYALTKRVAEDVCRSYAPINLKIVRPVMPYGPGVPPGPGRRALDNLVYQALCDEMMVVHANASRSWCWIADVASAIRCVIERGEPGVYNVGRDDDEIAMIDLAIAIRDEVRRMGLAPDGTFDAPIKVAVAEAAQTLVKRISCRKLVDLGWEPETSMSEGLPKMIEWIYSWMKADRISPRS